MNSRPGEIHTDDAREDTKTPTPADAIRRGRDVVRQELRTCCDNPQLHWLGSAANAAIECGSCGFVLADDGQLIDWHDPEQIAWEREQNGSS